MDESAQQVFRASLVQRATLVLEVPMGCAVHLACQDNVVTTV